MQMECEKSKYRSSKKRDRFNQRKWHSMEDLIFLGGKGSKEEQNNRTLQAGHYSN